MRLVVARCSARYTGRLSAHLPLATRVLIVKADGSVLLHSDGGSYKPLNWMSPPCSLVVREPSEEARERGVTEVWAVQHAKSDDRLEIHGTEGIVWVNRCTGKLLEEPSVVLYREGETRAFHELATDWADSFRAGTRDFADALLEGRDCFQSAADARKTLAFALAAARSAEEGREVTIAELG